MLISRQSKMKKFEITISVIILILLGYIALPVKKPLGSLDNMVYFSTTASTSTTSVAGASTVVLPLNTARRYAVCSNTGGFTAFLALANTASKSWGVVLPASSSYQIRQDNLYIGNVSAITNGGTTRVTCVEDR